MGIVPTGGAFEVSTNMIQVCMLYVYIISFIVCLHLMYRYKQCQQQTNSSDCGLFAVAFAAVLASGGHPSSFRFHQESMRGHLHSCLQNGLLSSFPTRRIGRENRKFTCFCRIVPVFCNSRMPETFSREMIRCDQCLNWFHLDLCVPVANTCEKWFCKDCS